jgi:hypothetical protein
MRSRFPRNVRAAAWRGPVVRRAGTRSGAWLSRCSAARKLRPVCALIAALALALVPLACKRKAAAPLLSVVEMSNLQAQTQLVSGFYAVEAGAWRWTRRNFSVLLAPPPGAAQNGAWLRARVTAPDSLIAMLNTVTLSARIAGQSLAPETYSAPGNYVYERAVPAAALRDRSTTVSFALDKVMPPGGGDLRELGIVVLSVGLEPK